MAAAVDRLAERARTEGWTHEEFLAACLEREVAARQDHGGEARIRAARFPPAKPSRSSTSTTSAPSSATPSSTWAPSTSSPPRRTSCSSGRPGTGKTHLSIGLGIRAAQAGHRVAFATAAEWVARLGEAHTQGRLHAELARLGRIPLLVVDEVGYIPFDGEAANLFFQLISARYERASVIVTSNKPFGRWGEVFGDPVVAAAMIDRLVHHAGGRLPQRRQLPAPQPRPRDSARRRRSVTTPQGEEGSALTRRQGVNIRPSLTVLAARLFRRLNRRSGRPESTTLLTHRSQAGPDQTITVGPIGVATFEVPGAPYLPASWPRLLMSVISDPASSLA
jgi:DNA replication protein DnaC